MYKFRNDKMENLKLARIDFRLIHGQVMTRWVKALQTKSIIVIDDRSYTNPLLRKILFGMAPSGVNVFVESVDSAAERWKNGLLPTDSSIILFKSTDTALRAWKAGVKFSSLQVGGIEGAGDKKNIFKNVVMNQTEANQLKELDDEGVRVYFQPIPEDTEYAFKDAFAKF